MEPWTKRYFPERSQDILGQEDAVKQLNLFVKNYKQGKYRTCILYGPIGSGKTSAAIAAAKENRLEIVEMNASDFRNKDKIESFIGTAMKQQSLFFSGKVILIDELDGLSGKKDRGGIPTLLKLSQKSSFPVICTVNDPYEKKLSSLRKKSLLIKFEPLNYKIIFQKLKDILEKEKCEYEEDALKALARRSGGDMRASINDLQIISSSGSSKVSKEDVLEHEQHERNRTELINNAIMKVLKTTDINVARKAFDNINDDFDKVMLWLEENVPREYEGKDLEKAFMTLSKADVYKGRIRRWQYWRLLVYIIALCSAGIALSKEKKYAKPADYKEPERLLKIWIANMKYKKRDAIAEKIATLTHTSLSRAKQEYLPYLKALFKDQELQKNIIEELELDNEEVAWIKKQM